jgi:hypothetical protein
VLNIACERTFLEGAMSLIDAEILEGILSRAAHLVTPEESFRLAGLPPGLTVVASPRDGAPSRVVWTILTAENGGRLTTEQRDAVCAAAAGLVTVLNGLVRDGSLPGPTGRSEA